ncbi:ClC family H(+)/Cl(-) exchange transporter [Vallitalea maricola]|uniref:ClC family H(+)/Cl(-) exchange transporter n=1 Tax=Vallitalea maricola TaxID=3074433 RepID=A0ACB5UEG3_9FIRM|nr:ClC family H(+)/Cl(-) exchange transporter [Vallitalea sp. AN17-2]
MSNNNKTTDTLNHWYTLDLKVILEGIIIGFITGLIIVSYRVCLSHADEIRDKAYEFMSGKTAMIILWFVLLIIVGIILGALVKKYPMIKGSGIPQIKGFLVRQLGISWLKELVLKFFGGILSIGFGLSLGREGPSVQMGATAGLGFSRIFKRFHLEEKYLVTAGASAGLAAAFNAPLAGVIFALEELHRNFSPIILMCAMGASITADFVSSNFFGLKPIFDFTNLEILPLKYYLMIVGLGIIAAVLGKLFNNLLLLASKHIDGSKKIKSIYKPVIPLLISGILGFTIPSILGGGHELIVRLTNENMLIKILIVLFILKLLFTVISYGSGVPGGIFLPVLVLGALIGKAYGQVCVSVFNIDEVYILNFITLAMAAYFTAIVKAPITGSILVTEMTGSFNHLLPLITICLVAQVVTGVINSGAIYDLLLEKLLKNKKGNYMKEAGEKKVILEVPVMFGSEIEHRKIKNITWPSNCLVVGIRRGEKELIPNGEYKIYAGDFLIILTDSNDADTMKLELLDMATVE